jgi:hypothetical protein
MRHDIENHLSQFPHSVVVETEGRLYGHWVIGNNYRAAADYHGAYPNKYLERVLSLFPNYENVLHLFSGGLKTDEPTHWTFDINPETNPNRVGSANRLSEYFPQVKFDLILADPPYDKANAKIYGYPMPNIPKVFREMRKVVNKDALVVWLCTRKPMYSNEDWEWMGTIALDCGTNRLFRGVFLFQPRS